jgi:metal-sulfur cluster biosynthetic enzyme
MPVTEGDVRAILKTILDPDIHISIVDLGMIYGVEVEQRPDGKAKVRVRMTLTTPACPYGPALLSQVNANLETLPGVGEVAVDLVWIPPWDPKTMASDEVKLKMGLFELDDLDDDEEEPAKAATPSPQTAKKSV